MTGRNRLVGSTVILIVLAAAVACSRSEQPREARLLGFVDSPVSGAAVSGTVEIRGWAASDNGIKKVCVSMDQQQQAVCTEVVQITRADVGQSYPDIKDSIHSGWAIPLDSKSVSNGSHRLVVDATSKSDQSTRLAEFAVTVAN